MSVRKRDGSPAFPSWHGLLVAGAEMLEAEQKKKAAAVVRALLDEDIPDLLAAARRAKDALGPLWFRFVEASFGLPWNKVMPESLRLASAIWRIGSPLVITTNYDRVLQWACPWQNDVRVWTLSSRAPLLAARRFDFERPTVWHIHGNIDVPEEIVLTPDGYTALYGDVGVEPRYRAALDTMRHVFAGRTVLFVGFSLSDDAVRRQIEWVRDLFANAVGSHFMLARTADVATLKLLLRDLPVELLTFEDFGQPLLALVEELANAAGIPSWARAVSPDAELVDVISTAAHDDELGILDYQKRMLSEFKDAGLALQDLTTNLQSFKSRLDKVVEDIGSAKQERDQARAEEVLDRAGALMGQLAHDTELGSARLRGHYFAALAAAERYIRLSSEDIELDFENLPSLVEMLESTVEVIDGSRAHLVIFIKEVRETPRLTASLRRARKELVEANESLLHLFDEIVLSINQLIVRLHELQPRTQKEE